MVKNRLQKMAYRKEVSKQFFERSVWLTNSISKGIKMKAKIILYTAFTCVFTASLFGRTLNENEMASVSGRQACNGNCTSETKYSECQPAKIDECVGCEWLDVSHPSTPLPNPPSRGKIYGDFIYYKCTSGEKPTKTCQTNPETVCWKTFDCQATAIIPNQKCGTQSTCETGDLTQGARCRSSKRGAEIAGLDNKVKPERCK